MKKLFFFALLLFSIQNTIAQCFTKISGGRRANHALKTDGTFWGWGQGDGGQHGDGNNTDYSVPTPLPFAGAIQSFVSTGFCTFILTTTGQLWGAGFNTTGQLGINSTALSGTSFVQVGTASNWRQVSSSSSFTGAVKTDNTLWVWGENNTNQMGNATCCANRLVPGQLGTANDLSLIHI